MRNVCAAIDAVFFDFGGVILASPFEAFAAYEQRMGLPRNFIRTVNATNPDHNAWALLERNAIGVEQFVDEFEREAIALGHRVEGRAVLECLHGDLRPEMVEVVRRCSDRWATALLTNNIASMATSGVSPASSDGESAAAQGPRTDYAEVISYFDVIVESSVVGVRKPEPRFYEIACELASVRPERVVFLDDLGVNLKPAREMGMRTIKVADVDTAIAELEAILETSLREQPAPGRSRSGSGSEHAPIRRD